ncbi:hypothetical protein [Streptomyces sp. NPDC006477]|uniref:hypothetical protein n=1 Tax=Streptomyces sp. NPDC006477 TaxID=3364747 RepID=UPI0036CD54AE
MNVIEGQVFLADELEVVYQPNWLGLLIGVILPILVGLVTKTTTSASTKAVLLAFLSALTGILTEYVDVLANGGAYNWSVALYTWGGAFILAVATHFGLWKPTGVSASAQRSMVK